jgi:hypothetical protein
MPQQLSHRGHTKIHDAACMSHTRGVVNSDPATETDEIMKQMLRTTAIHYVYVIHALHRNATNHLYLVPN